MPLVQFSVQVPLVWTRESSVSFVFVNKLSVHLKTIVGRVVSKAEHRVGTGAVMSWRVLPRHESDDF